MGRGIASRIGLVLAAVAGALGLMAPDRVQAAENPFAPVIYINGDVVTGYELEQRIAFLSLLRTPGDVEEQARQGLINDRLQQQAGTLMGIELSNEQITAGMEEFAKRANLSVEAFIGELQKGGVEPETFRDFVRSGLIWREAVRAKFQPTIRITDAEVREALSDATQKAEVRVLLNELVVPYDPDRQADALAFVTQLRENLKSEAEFQEAARRFSRSASAPAGGELDWLTLDKLPPALGGVILQMRPGQLSDVVSIPGAYVLFYIRGISDAATVAAFGQTLTYAQVLLPQGPDLGAQIAQLRNNVDRCEDLYTAVKKLPGLGVSIAEQPSGEVPRDVAAQLAKMDPGDISTAVKRGNAQVFLMLCDRVPTPAEGVPNAEQMRNMLLGRRLQLAAETWQREMRAMAVIREP